MDMNHTMNKETEKWSETTARRVFFLNRAMERAQNPEFKDLWKRKKEELLKNL